MNKYSTNNVIYARLRAIQKTMAGCKAALDKVPFCL